MLIKAAALGKDDVVHLLLIAGADKEATTKVTSQVTLASIRTC